MKPSRKLLAHTIAALISITTVQATTFQWNGAIDGTWQNANNWSGGIVADFNGTFADRLNVNGPTTLIYDGSLGTTIYANTPAGSRGVVIGSGTLGAGSMTITGGTFSTAGSTAPDVIGNVNTAGATSALTIAGGNFIGNSTGFIVNFGGTANVCSLNIASGTATFSALTIGGSATGSATLNLDGGKLTATQINRINAGTSTATVNLNGGTLVAGGSSATFMQGMTNTYIKTGGAIIDCNGFDITIAQPLLDAPGGGGNLTKLGSGTLSLTGANAFTGQTTVTAGTLQIGDGGATGKLGAGAVVNEANLSFKVSGPLAVANSISGPGTVQMNGTGQVTLAGPSTYTGSTSVNSGRLDIANSITSSVTVAAGAALGGEGSTTGTVTFNGASTFWFDPSTPQAFTAASIAAAGAAVTLGLANPSPAVSGIVVLDAPGGITGAAGTNFLFTGRGSTYLNATNTKLLFDYAPGTLKWRGDDAISPGVWDVTKTSNWQNGATKDTFFSGDSVTFDDTATAFNVIIDAGGVVPGSITIDNTANVYTFSGGSITGGGALTKNGTADLALTAPNSYTGGTTINKGSVTTAVAGALGNGAVTIGSNGTLNLAGGAVTYTGVSTGLNGAGTINLTLGNAAETTPLDGANAGFTGTINVGIGGAPGAGKVRLNGALGAASKVNVLANASAYVSGAVTQPGAIVLNGGDTGESFGQLRLENGAIWSGPVTLAGDIVGTGDGMIGSNAGTGTISGVIGETGGPHELSKVGSGIITLSGANTYTGNTAVLTGAVIVTANNALGTTAGGTTVALNATLGLSGNVDYATTEPLTLNGPGALGAGYFFANSAVQRGALQSVSGNNRWSGDISFSGTNLRIGVQDGATLTLTGNLIENIPGSTMTFRHGNTAGSDVIISGSANSWSGTTDIFGGGGAVKLGRDNALPIASLLRLGTSGILGASTFDLNGFSQNSAGLSQVNTSAAFVTNNGAAPSVLTLNPAGAPSFGGIIQDGTSKVGLVKAGLGTQTLTATNPYTGATFVEGGTLSIPFTGGLSGTTSVSVGGGADAAFLQVDGMVGAPSAITSVKTSGTLFGSGSINGSVVVDPGGAISPGVGPGMLTISDSFNLKTGGHLSLDLFANFAGGGYDQLAVMAGNVSLAGDLDGSILAFAPVEFQDVLFVILNNGTGTTTGTLNGVGEGGLLLVGGQPFRVSYRADASSTTAMNFGTALGNDVALMAVPEPSTFLGALLGLGILGSTRRRRGIQ